MVPPSLIVLLTTVAYGTYFVVLSGKHKTFENINSKEILRNEVNDKEIEVQKSLDIKLQNDFKYTLTNDLMLHDDNKLDDDNIQEEKIGKILIEKKQQTSDSFNIKVSSYASMFILR
ncbi:unnamed protein product [Meganyctiphanes norvegica]|uniref:Uncharacterized protein n=1 Tax=Meganyctiphanes norvegica TaxID=48144 RepID=A0AAV2QG16_MEGNR